MAPSGEKYFEGKDLFVLPDGSTYHLGAKAGEIPPRILTVGAYSRAERIATLFEKRVLSTKSGRDFGIFTGKYKGEDVAVISIGMGAPMMDFLMREVSFVQPKPLAVIRLGTCGILNPAVKPGTVMLSSKGSSYCQLDYTYLYGNAYEDSESKHPFQLSKPVQGDPSLGKQLKEALGHHKLETFDGLNVSCETFYAAQGRRLEEFDDKNDTILDDFRRLGVDSIEMETHQLFHQAHTRRTPCYAASAAIGIVNRSADFPNISADLIKELEIRAGQACLDALAGFTFGHP